MIQIQEIYPPRKLSGLTSLLVSFDYNAELVNTIKTIPNAIYHKKDFKWEVPIYALTSLLDAFSLVSPITLKLLDSSAIEIKPFSGSQPLTDSEIDHFKIRPLEHQIEAVNYGLAHKKFLLLDGMGVGKSFSIIVLAEALKRRGLIDHCFLVCVVNATKQNWKKEIKKFSHESCMILGEKISARTGKSTYASIAERAEILKNPIEEFYVITNIETLRDEKIIKAFKTSKNNFGMIAVDEIHRASNKSSTQGANLLKLDAPYKVAATGTLLTNSPISMYLPLAWTENDQATLTNYKAQYCKFGGFNNSQILGYKNLDNLKEELSHCSIRRTLKDVRSTMPPKTIVTELVEMSDEHRKFYEAVKDGIKEEVDKVYLNSANCLALTTRLRQATACPELLTSQPIVSSKLERCAELVEDLYNQGEKVVVLATFKESINQLAKMLDKFNPTINTGDIDDSIVSKNVDIFQNDPFSKVFLGTFGKCSTGLTLNAASYLIALDENWTAAQNNQAWDRIYRLTNINPAFITILMCKDTIDERVHSIAQMKQDLSDYVVDDVNNHIAQSLKNEMISILRDL